MKQTGLRLLSGLSWKTGAGAGFRWLADRAYLKRNFEGSAVFPYVTRRQAPSFQILTYHRLARTRDPFFPALFAEVFERQVGYLARHYRIVDLVDLLQQIRQGEPIPANAVAITFDDGYRDNYDLAFPILQRFGATMTVFLTTSFVNGEDILWNDKIRFAVKHTVRPELVVDWSEQRRYPLKTLEQRLEATGELLRYLRRIPHVEKLQRIGEVLSNLGVHDFGPLWQTRLNWRQVRFMQERGIRFGAHTVTHPILTLVPLEAAREEIRQSKRSIEFELRAPVELFAYPNGTVSDFNESLKAVLAEESFLAAVTTVFGFNSPNSDFLALRRVVATEDLSIANFANRQCWYKFVS